MTEAVIPSTPPVAVEKFELNKKEDKEIQAMKIKTNASLDASVIDASGRRAQSHVDVAKSIQVPQ